MNSDSKFSASYYGAGQDIHFRMTTPEEEKALFIKAYAGDEEAKEFVIKNHLLFALMEGQKLVRNRLERDEVISACNYAVMKAYRLFDPEVGVRFTTYLRPFIRGEIANLWRSHFNSSGVADPSIANHREDLFSSADGLVTSCQSREMSENGTTVNNGRAEREPFYEDMTMGHEAESNDLRDFNFSALRGSLTKLSEREQDLLNEVYQNEKSFAEIARDTGVTREAVRSMHERVVSKLRKSLKVSGVKEVA